MRPTAARRKSRSARASSGGSDRSALMLTAQDAFLGNRVQRNLCCTWRKSGRTDMKAKLFSAAVIVAASMQGASAYAANVLTVDHLKAIGEFAKDICQRAPMDSSKEELILSARIETKLPKLFSSLGKLGGDLKWKETETRGVLQTKLHEVIKDSNDCRRDVLGFVKDFLGRERRGSVNWVPIFSPWKIELVSPCKKSVACKLPNRRDSSRYGYNISTVFSRSGGSARITYPANIGRLSTSLGGGKTSVQFKYLGTPDDKFGNVEVCLCLVPNR